MYLVISMRILDATTSNKSMWYQKDNPFTVFMDMRKGIFSPQTPNMKTATIKKCGVYKVFPDIQARWQHLPFKDECFDMIVFDPPHISGSSAGISQRYGFLTKTWKYDMSEGLKELFRVLKNEGSFIFKWNEREIQIKEVLNIFPYNPMFGTRTGTSNKTHWIVFIKHRHESQLSNFE